MIDEVRHLLLRLAASHLHGALATPARGPCPTIGGNSRIIWRGPRQPMGLVRSDWTLSALGQLALAAVAGRGINGRFGID
jgi:hypothetical protein